MVLCKSSIVKVDNEFVVGDIETIGKLDSLRLKRVQDFVQDDFALREVLNCEDNEKE